MSPSQLNYLLQEYGLVSGCGIDALGIVLVIPMGLSIFVTKYFHMTKLKNE
jgi:hypothetical protein